MDAGGAAPSIGTPIAEFAIDTAFVAGLLADQHPDLAHLPLRVVDAGWDNAMFRLGDHLAVRLPRRAAAAPLIAHEQTWLLRLADQLSLPVPAPQRIGGPARGYPWRWSVVPWLKGWQLTSTSPMLRRPAYLQPFCVRSTYLHPQMRQPILCAASPFGGAQQRLRHACTGLPAPPT